LKVQAAVLYGVSLGQTILNVRPRRDGSSAVTSPNHVHLSDSNAAEIKNSDRTCMGTEHASTAIVWIPQRPGTSRLVLLAVSDPEGQGSGLFDQ